MSNQELRDEEKEVLMSIYEGDDCFRSLTDNTYQYRVGDAGHFQSFLLEVSWSPEYPDELPTISLEAFYNKHINKAIKEHVVAQVTAEAEQWLGSAMTYTLFEFAKENAEDLMKDQVETVQQDQDDGDDDEPEGNGETNHTPVGKKKVKKEQLTKAQKRKLADRMDHKGERPRGWDWVDVIKLSKTGSVENK